MNKQIIKTTITELAYGRYEVSPLPTPEGPVQLEFQMPYKDQIVIVGVALSAEMVAVINNWKSIIGEQVVEEVIRTLTPVQNADS